MYDSVYESIERPPQWVIDDDDLLDEWLKQQHEELENRAEEEYRKKRSDPKNKSLRTAWEHEEVITIDSNVRYDPRPPRKGG